MIPIVESVIDDIAAALLHAGAGWRCGLAIYRIYHLNLMALAERPSGLEVQNCPTPEWFAQCSVEMLELL